MEYEKVLPKRQRLCLRVFAGPYAGREWHFTESPVTIGRGVGCHLRLDDPHVSRIQCELTFQNNVTQYQNLSQRTPAQINGAVREEAILNPGDILEFADVHMILDYAPLNTPEVAPLFPDMRTTQGFSDAVHLQERYDAVRYKQAPALIVDLHGLFNLVRGLGQCESLDALTHKVKAHLSERFSASTVWLGWRVRADSNLALYPPTSPEETKNAPTDTMTDACNNKAGVSGSRHLSNKDVFLAAAPLLHANEAFGSLCVCRPKEAGAFTNEELTYLVTVSECCAPLIRAAERLEQLRRDVQQYSVRQGVNSGMLGSSDEAQNLLVTIRKVAIGRTNVLILGETGVGKELAARMLHDLSKRAFNPYVVLNCAAIPSELFESELFGYARGAFTGAAKARKGIFEQAHGGTLFLDEVGDLSLTNQARILRAVENGTFRPVGAEKELKVDVRVISATNRLLPDPDQRFFRMDLYHRLAGTVIRIPPIRDRRGDIGELANHFLQMSAPNAPSHPKGFTQDAMEKLVSYSWPGNVREIQNVVERACYTTSSEFITTTDLVLDSSSKSIPNIPPQASLDDVERIHLIESLKSHNGNVQDTAHVLGLSRSALYYKLARHGISAREHR